MVYHRDDAAVSCNGAPDAGEQLHPYASQHGLTLSAAASLAEFPMLGSARPASQILTELCDVPEASARPCKLIPMDSRADRRRLGKEITEATQLGPK